MYKHLYIFCGEHLSCARLRPSNIDAAAGSVDELTRIVGQILDTLAKAGVAFVALKENIRVEGKCDIQTKVMITLFALFAEV